MIVMRELIPDQIAQEFLKYFLTAFSDGQPFHLAVQIARQRLHGLEDKFPCATWLPIICHNPLEPPMIWKQHRKIITYKSLRAVFLTTQQGRMVLRNAARVDHGPSEYVTC